VTDQIAARHHDLEWRRIDDEVVILDLRTQRYLTLNHTGAILWPLLVAGTTRQLLIAELVDIYPDAVTEAGRDVDAVLGQLTEADLLA
jgi:hypothetical protein